MLFIFMFWWKSQSTRDSRSAGVWQSSGTWIPSRTFWVKEAHLIYFVLHLRVVAPPQGNDIQYPVAERGKESNNPCEGFSLNYAACSTAGSTPFIWNRAVYFHLPHQDEPGWMLWGFGTWLFLFFVVFILQAHSTCDKHFFFLPRIQITVKWSANIQRKMFSSVI